MAIVGPQSSSLSAAGKMVGESAAAQLSAVLDQELSAGRRFARLDLSNVPMLDHAGFDALVAAHRQCLAAGGALVLTGVSPRIARLLQLTGFDQMLFTVTAPPPSRHPRGSRLIAADQPDTTNPNVIDERPDDSAEGSPEHQRVINRAVGVVMGRTGGDSGDASERLTLIGRVTHRTLLEVAQSILGETRRVSQRTVYGHLTWSDVVPAPDPAGSQPRCASPAPAPYSGIETSILDQIR